MTLEQLIAARAALVAARANGLREVRDADGSAVVYRSDREMAAALAAIDSDILRLAGASKPSIIRFVTSKGL